MKKNGMTLVESVVTVALVGVIFLLVVPVLKSFGQVKNRVHSQRQIDKEFSNVNAFIQKKIRSAKRTSKGLGSSEEDFNIGYVGVFNSFTDDSSAFFTSGSTGNRIDDGGEGSALFLEVPSSSSNSDFVFLYFKDKQLFYQEGFNPPPDSGNPVLLMDSVEGYFRLREGIVVYSIKLDLGLDPGDEKKFRTSLKSSATTRIDIVR